MRKFLLLVVALLVIGIAAQAQTSETCDDEVIAEFVAASHEELEMVETFDDFVRFNALVNLAVDSCREADEQANTQTNTGDDVVGFSRSNPVPLGDWFTFDGGQVRVVNVETRTDISEFTSLYTLEPGNTLAIVDIEYLCLLEDEDVPCEGTDVARQAVYVTSGGEVIDEATLFATLFDDGILTDKEAYSGATITGRIHFIVPSDEELNLLRVGIIGTDDHVFFAMSEAEE